jgi:ketosteroid isomerase-like protein
VPSNLEIVGAYLEALERGDRAASRAFMDPAIVLDMSGSDIPERGVYEGLAGIERFAASWNEAWESYGLEVKHVIEVPPDRVLTLVEEFGRSNSGVELEGQQTADLYTLRDERIVRVYEFPTWTAALDALGLSRPG